MTVATGSRVPLNSQAPVTLVGMHSTAGWWDESTAAIVQNLAPDLRQDAVVVTRARSPSTCLNHLSSWFQLAKMRLTTSRPNTVNNLQSAISRTQRGYRTGRRRRRDGAYVVCVRTGERFGSELVDDKDIGVRRNRERTRIEAATMVIPTVTKPTVTKPSCHRCPLRPAAVIGDIAAVPRIAVSNVTTQCA